MNGVSRGREQAKRCGPATTRERAQDWENASTYHTAVQFNGSAGQPRRRPRTGTSMRTEVARQIICTSGERSLVALPTESWTPVGYGGRTQPADRPGQAIWSRAELGRPDRDSPPILASTSGNGDVLWARLPAAPQDLIRSRHGRADSRTAVIVGETATSRLAMKAIRGAQRSGVLFTGVPEQHGLLVSGDRVFAFTARELDEATMGRCVASPRARAT